MINIEENRNSIVALLKCTERKGIDNILDYMDENGYYTAPCSTKYHLCCDGGLQQHSKMVYNMMNNLACNSIYFTGIKHSSIILTAILHDIGKSGYRGEQNYLPNVLKSGRQSTQPFKTNPDKNYISHEVLSLMIIHQCGLEITESEEYAILHHNGMYGNLKNELMNNEQPLQQLLHFADMWSSRFLEKE